MDWLAQLSFRGTAAKLVPLIEGRVKKAGAQTIQNLARALRDDYPAPELGALQKVADSLVFPGMFGFTKYGYRSGLKSWNPVTANMRNKHVVITGATSGLGLETAMALAARGARLTLVGRDEQKCKNTLAQIQSTTGNENVGYETADLGLMADVHNLSQRLLKKNEPIDVLINNAGALLNPRRETSEGLEASFALLLLSPVTLTENLLPLLKLSGQARVINVSSGGMYAKRISVSNLQSTKGTYGGADAYARAKRGLVIMGEEWAKAWADFGITIHNMHPGWAFTPGLEAGLPDFAVKMRKVLRDTKEGADTIIWLACATEVGKTSGLFWLDRLPHTTHLISKTRETKQQREDLKQALKAIQADFA